MNLKLGSVITTLILTSVSIARADGVSDGGGDECYRAPAAEFRYDCSIELTESSGEQKVSFRVTSENIGEGFYNYRRQFSERSSYRVVRATINFCPDEDGSNQIYTVIEADLRIGQGVRGISGTATSVTDAPSFWASARVELESGEERGAYLVCKRIYWRPLSHR